MHRNALPAETQLLWYNIERALGYGAFGITYLAKDTHLDRVVAIKEYLPGQFARREIDATVQPLTEELVEEYDAGLRNFISEARTLSQFEHPNIVRVHHVFEANLTAYMVMQYEDGESLDRILKRDGTLDEPEVLRIVNALLGGLETIHARGFIHRDIKPANVFIRVDGSPVLLDFGSARQAQTGEARTLTNFVSPGYAPIEQYIGKSDQQGPWSDIYGLGATLYRAMTGRPPADAIERSQSIAHDARDAFQGSESRVRRHYSPALLLAVDRALQFRTQDRPQSVAAWRHLLPADTFDIGSSVCGDTSSPLCATPVGPEDAATPSPTQTLQLTQAAGSGTRAPWLRPKSVAIALGVIATVAGGGYLLRTEQSASGTTNSSDAGTTFRPQHQAALTPPGFDPPTTSLEGTNAVSGNALSSSGPQALGVERQSHIAALLRRARNDVEARRFMTPAGSNAYDKYREVLHLEPGHVGALQGIDTISDRYVALVYREIDRRKFQQGEAYLRRAESLTPDRITVRNARVALESRRQAARVSLAQPTPASTPAPSSASISQRLGNFFKAGSELESAPIEDRSDEFRKRLGGR